MKVKYRCLSTTSIVVRPLVELWTIDDPSGNSVTIYSIENSYQQLQIF